MQELRMETIVRENKPVDLGDKVVKCEFKKQEYMIEEKWRHIEANMNPQIVFKKLGPKNAVKH